LSGDLSERLQRIEEKLDSLVRMLEEKLSAAKSVSITPLKVNVPKDASINVYLMKLPDSLRQTMLAMDKLKEATTMEVAKKTGRSRSVESIHLNQLERMGYLEKYRKGRKIYFRIPSPPRE